MEVNARANGAPNEEVFRPAITKRRLEVLCELYKSGKISQGELARRTQMKATALSNLLLKLDSLYPKLFVKEYEGKFCYYALSDWGRHFAEQYLEPAQEQKSDTFFNREDEVLFYSAQESLQEMEQLYGDDWPVAFNDVLMHYMIGDKLLPDPQAKVLVSQYFRSLELLTIHENERFCSQTLGLVPDPVNRSRIAKFIDDYFEPFIVVLRGLGEKRQTLSISIILRSVFTGQREAAEEKAIEAMGWDAKVLQKLEAVALRLRGRFVGYTMEDIYEYLMVLLPNQDMLSALISQWLAEN